MNILVFVETGEGKVRKTSLEAIAYAHQMGGEVSAIVLGSAQSAELELLGKYGAKKILHVADAKLDHAVIQVYASVINQAMQEQSADVLVLANSSLGSPVAAKVAIKANASFASNVVELPITTNGFVVKRSIYTGKAFSFVELKNQKKVIAIKKNAAEAKEIGSNVSVTPYSVALNDADGAIDRFLAQVVDHHIVAAERHDMGNTVAHLACADDADLSHVDRRRAGCRVFRFDGGVHRGLLLKAQ